jgi:hypothetical protein
MTGTASNLQCLPEGEYGQAKPTCAGADVNEKGICPVLARLIVKFMGANFVLSGLSALKRIIRIY